MILLLYKKEKEIFQMRTYEIIYQHSYKTFHSDFVSDINKKQALDEWQKHHPKTPIVLIKYIHEKPLKWVF